MTKIQLVTVGKLLPAAYNPRKADSTRLEFVKMSLQKLGWLLPIYATPEGEILSGHQRHSVAVSMGYTHVPVVYVECIDDAKRKSLNIVFNKATNDMRKNSRVGDLYERLREYDYSFAKDIPDKIPNTPMAYPCMRCRKLSVSELVGFNSVEGDS